ncbi:MAG: DUF951 domain-containing protein [Faecalibacterium sp.]
MDFKIRCTGCGHEVMLPRAKIEKNIKKGDKARAGLASGTARMGNECLCMCGSETCPAGASCCAADADLSC